MSRYAAFVDQYLDVRGATGDERVCVCIFHSDTGKPNLYVNVAKGVFVCHSCGAKGTITKIAAELGVEIRDMGIPLSQLRSRLDRLGELPRTKREVVLPETRLAPFEFPHPFWSERGFSASTIQTWKLGYDPTADQAIIPFRNPQGDLLGVIRRRLDDERPKYVYPKGSNFRRYLFGAWVVRTKKVAIVEGPLDVIACWQARVPALGLMGSRITPDQCRLLRQMGVQTIVLMTDNDDAGQKAAEQVRLEMQGVIIRRGTYRDYWSATDPGGLNPIQIRKLYHSAVPWSGRQPKRPQ